MHTKFECLRFTQNIARQAGSALLGYRHEHVLSGKLKIHLKADKTIVTEADILAEKTIKDAIRIKYPHHNIISEESYTEDQAQITAESYCWLIDPLDGSRNFIKGRDDFAVSIALYQGGNPLVSVVYNPAKRRMFSSAAGTMTMLNGKPFRARKANSFSELIGALHFSKTPPHIAKYMETLAATHMGIRTIGTTATMLAETAVNMCDFAIYPFPSIWGAAAGIGLAKEAGKEVVNIATGQSIFPLNIPSIIANKFHFGSILVCNPEQTASLLEIIRNTY